MIMISRPSIRGIDAPLSGMIDNNLASQRVIRVRFAIRAA